MAGIEVIDKDGNRKQAGALEQPKMRVNTEVHYKIIDKDGNVKRTGVSRTVSPIKKQNEE
jgi:hypothetical protein